MFRGYVGKFFAGGLPTMFQPSAFLRFFCADTLRGCIIEILIVSRLKISQDQLPFLKLRWASKMNG